MLTVPLTMVATSAAMGGVLVAVDVRAVDTTIIADALRLWPFAFVAIGLGLVLRRTRLSVPGGMLAAAVPGLCWAVASRWPRGLPRTVVPAEGFARSGRSARASTNEYRCVRNDHQVR